MKINPLEVLGHSLSQGYWKTISYLFETERESSNTSFSEHVFENYNLYKEIKTKSKRFQICPEVESFVSSLLGGAWIY